jgi:general secretion pathway protein A
MFLEYYQLREQPFGVTPDPRFLYFGPTHREALASLIYAIESRRGFSAMVAEPGMGKTTLLFRLLETLRNTTRTAFLFQTEGDSRDLLRGVLADLGVPTPSHDLGTLHESLNAALVEEMRAGRQVVVVLDEAQNLDEKSLESVRMLSNFETSTQKLIHIVLAGQPKLGERLAGPELKQLRQRVSTIIHLHPLSPEETEAYIDWRLRVAGHDGQPIFMPEAIDVIGRVSKGIPRDINSLCFQALSIGFAMKSRTVGSEIMREVVADLDPNARPARRPYISSAAPAPRSPMPRAPEIDRTPLGGDLSAAPSPAAAAFRPRPAQVHAVAEMPTASLFSSWAIAPPPERSSGLKKLAIAACVMVPVMLIVGFSLPRLGLGKALAAKLSGQTVNQGPDAGGAPSQFTPNQPVSSEPSPMSPVEGPDETTTAAQSQIPAPASIPEATPAPAPDASSNSATTSAAAEPRPSSEAREQTAPSAITGMHSAIVDDTQVHDREPSPTPRKNSVVEVTHRENLFEFALENYGKSNREIVDAICQLNPKINGPFDMLKTGEWIQLPSEPEPLTSEARNR